MRIESRPIVLYRVSACYCTVLQYSVSELAVNTVLCLYSRTFGRHRHVHDFSRRRTDPRTRAPSKN